MSAAPRSIDDLADPRLPWLLRAVNAVPGPLARRAQPLEEAELLEAARRASGLDDFGEPSFLEPLRVLLRSLEREAGLSPFGRLGVRRLLIQLLCSRLRVEGLIRRHPEIESERIERPLVVAGLPRTGTTHLLNLLACDCGLRTLPYWESLEPVPPEGEAGDSAPRIARCERSLAFMDRVMPLFRAMHEFTPEGPHEEIQLLALQFSTQLFEASYAVPSYAEWYRETDQTPAYRYLARVLKALQWLRRGERWALKSPQHLENLGPLLATFPDATLLQTHRDPVRIVASLATMIAYGRRMSRREVDPHAIGRHWAGRLEDMLRASVRDRALIPEAQVRDVPFHAFMKDEFATLERVFAFAERPMDEATAASARRFLAQNPRGKHGAIRYRLEDLGLDAGALRERFRFYQERFDVPWEELL